MGTGLRQPADAQRRHAARPAACSTLHAEPVDAARVRRGALLPPRSADQRASSSRRDKVILYEVGAPAHARGGRRSSQRGLLPPRAARFARATPGARGGPGGDRASARTGRRCAAAMAPTDEVPFVSLEEMDRFWEGRPVSEGAYRARIEPSELASDRLTPSEQRHVFFSVRNDGTERWPAAWRQSPQIRLSYRWLNADGSVQDGGPALCASRERSGQANASSPRCTSMRRADSRATTCSTSIWSTSTCAGLAARAA